MVQMTGHINCTLWKWSREEMLKSMMVRHILNKINMSEQQYFINLAEEVCVE
jgi:hypothetical protein